ncbi:hypothetical protein C8R46DRAFT_1354178 [Mycena filopes]|nr:hypothetical protein C8R46DRAFT_1354178 [Mycena filopes]
MRTTTLLALVFAALTAAMATPAGDTTQQNLCCPSIDARIPRGTLGEAQLLGNELCCGYTDGTVCCYELTGFLITPGNSCLVFLSDC